MKRKARPSRYMRRSKRRRTGLSKRKYGLKKYMMNRVSVKRTFFLATRTWDAAATSGFYSYDGFSLSNLPSVAEFQTLFDEYKINAVKVTFRPNIDYITEEQSGAAAVTTNNVRKSVFHVAIDPVYTVPTGTYTSTVLNTFLEQQGVRSYNANRPFSVFYKPKVPAIATGGTTASTVGKPQWYKTADTGIAHNGFYWFWQTQGFNNAMTIKPALDVYVTMYMQFKNLK